MPRYRSSPRQHHLPYPMPHNLIGFCEACDFNVEHNLPLSLSYYCDCNQYKRWICLPCKGKEGYENREYYRTRTKVVPGDLAGVAEMYEGLWQDEVLDVTGVRRLFILLFATVTSNTNSRCIIGVYVGKELLKMVTSDVSV
jgi:hypothetical protein